MTDKASNVDLLARIAELEHECERLQGEFDYAHADSTNEVTREALYRAEIANLKAIVDGTWVCGFLSNLRQAIGDTEGKLDFEEIPKAVADLKRRLEDAELMLDKSYAMLDKASRDIWQTAQANRMNLDGVDLAIPEDGIHKSSIGTTLIPVDGINESLAIRKECWAVMTEIREVLRAAKESK